MPTISENRFPKILLAEGAAPATPPAGHIAVYVDVTGSLRVKDDAGSTSTLADYIGAGAGGASYEPGEMAVDFGAFPGKTELDAVVSGLTTPGITASSNMFLKFAAGPAPGGASASDHAVAAAFCAITHGTPVENPPGSGEWDVPIRLRSIEALTGQYLISLILFP